MRKVRFGVISTARIGTEKVIPAMQKCEHCEITAIASRDIGKAGQAANRLGIPKFYGRYEDLLADPDIDAVYNPLPNHLHVSWSVRALEAGKHVLCEKPLALDAAEAEDLVRAAETRPDLKVMEAFMYRFHPQWRQTLSWIQSGAVGTLRTILSVFSYYNDDPGNIRNQPDIGGGGLMDIGCYNISLSRFLFGESPLEVSGMMDKDPVLGTDRLTSGMLRFSGGTSVFTCSTQLSHMQRVIAMGTLGRIELEIPFNAPNDKPVRIWLNADAGEQEMTFEICDQYTLQGDAFALSILKGTPVPTPLSDAVENMKVIDAVMQSAASGTAVRL